MIVPSIGRKVWYRPNGRATLNGKPIACYSDQPMDATVICVWSDRCVNLMVVDHAGNLHAAGSVMLRQEGDHHEICGSYCQWMPYQVAQAEKAPEPPAPPPADHAYDAFKYFVEYANEQREDVTYTILPDGRTTVCQITLSNGFTVNGFSVAAHLELFDREIGEAGALDDASYKAVEFQACIDKTLGWQAAEAV